MGAALSPRLWLAVVLVAGWQSGCASLRTKSNSDLVKPTPERLDVEKSIALINANAAKIKSIRCDNVDIDGRSEGKPYTLSAKLAFQNPQQFRLMGQFINTSEVDLGSNTDEIWFWIRRADPPALYFCKRNELANVRLSTPFQPDWIVEILGVTPLDAKQYREGGHSDDRIYNLVTDTRTPAGQLVTKRLVIDRKTQRVDAYQLFNPQRELLVQAWVKEYYTDPTTGAYVPRRVWLEWPDADTRMTISLNERRIELNTITPEFAASVFSRPEYSHTDVVDLAQLARQRGGRQALTARSGPAEVHQDERIQRVRGGAQLTGQIQSESPSGNE